MGQPATLLGTWFGCGLLPIAPGTWGSLAALPLAWALQSAGGPWAVLAAALVIFAVGCWAAHVMGKQSGEDDAGVIVIDEVAGQLLVLCFVPPGLVLYIVGFLLFRAMDILKPWPVNWADQKIKGGFGVMLDDVLAALYAIIPFAVLVNWWGT